jgi:hypothetical protein
MSKDQCRTYLVNGDFQTDFEFEEETPLLGIHNEGRVNRSVATQERIGKTSFSATLIQVQYGTYKGESACFAAMDFSFRFRSKSSCRYSYAEIRVAFTRAVDTQNHKVRNADPADDPRVRNMAPKEVYGTVNTIGENNILGLKVPVMFENSVDLSTSVGGQAEKTKTKEQENRIESHGHLYYDDDHDEDANAVTWDLLEDDATRSGIFRNFKVAIVVLNQPESPMWMDVVVKPSVKFSLDPRRLFEKNEPFARLLQRNDEPVLLDGKTPKYRQSELGCNDFSSPIFPWHEVLQLPVEYAVSGFIVTTERFKCF